MRVMGRLKCVTKCTGALATSALVGQGNGGGEHTVRIESTVQTAKRAVAAARGQTGHANPTAVSHRPQLEWASAAMATSLTLAPLWTVATRKCGSTMTCLISLRSMTRPSGHKASPASDVHRHIPRTVGRGLPCHRVLIRRFPA